jgi:DNA-binding CsgD family transcriptional regulator
MLLRESDRWTGPAMDESHSQDGVIESRGAGLSRLNDESMLRATAVLRDSESQMSLALPRLWKELSLGLCRITDSFFTVTRCFLVTRASGESCTPLDALSLQVLEAVLGEAVCQNSVALDLDVAPSTVAARTRSSLETLGVRDIPSRVTPLLMLTARAARLLSVQWPSRVSFVEHGDETLRVVSVARPDLSLPATPPAEMAVLRLLFEGHPYADIARARGTAARTVANQLAAVFRRFGVSGRAELVLRLFDLAVGNVGPAS